MSSGKNIFELFADILSYPTPEYHAKLAVWYQRMETYGEEINSSIQPFKDFVASKTSQELEEFFTQTFDINPVSCLEIGWHLFGESYDRGAFLVRMRELLRTHGIPESSELPDHINHVLLILARMEKTDASEFTHAQILPAVRKMLAGFENKENVYERTLQSLCAVLEAEFPKSIDPRVELHQNHLK